MTDSVLIVDDEDSVRRTFQDWLASVGPEVRVFAAADAESALRIANEHAIDLAVLDWNLGSGSDGLRLLEDLIEFQPDVVAILVTGFAHQATPLDALRMGVRDYLDKSTDLNRESFLAAVRKQLDRIRPAKQQRELNRSLAEFRDAVEKVLPIVRSTAAFNDPVPLPTAVQSLLRFLIRATGAADGTLILRHVSAANAETTVVHGPHGVLHHTMPIPFSRTLAASVVSLQEPIAVNEFDPASFGAVELLPNECNRTSLLAAPLTVGSGTIAVLELFDKPAPGFTHEDRRMLADGAEIGGELLRQAVAEKQTHQLLFDAVEAALNASQNITAAIASPQRLDTSPPAAVMERLRMGLDSDANAVIDADMTLQLIEAVRTLAVRHGSRAVEHCVRLVREVRQLLDALTEG